MSAVKSPKAAGKIASPSPAAKSPKPRTPKAKTPVKVASPVQPHEDEHDDDHGAISLFAGSAPIVLSKPTTGGSSPEAGLKSGQTKDTAEPHAAESAAKTPSLSPEKLVARDRAPLEANMAELAKQLQQIRAHLAPLADRIKQGELETANGVGFLDAKYQLLLSYCADLVHYMSHKASGRSVGPESEDFAETLASLIKTRIYLEKIRPLENKFKYQIDKYIKAATTGAGSGATSSAADALGSLSARPNVMNLDDGDSSDDGAAARSRAGKSAALQSATSMEAETVDRSKRSADRLVKSREQRNMLQELHREFTDAPEEIAEERPEEDDLERARTEHEEATFTRLQVTRKDRARLKRNTERSSDLRDLEEFSDITSLQVTKERSDFEDSLAARRPVAQVASAYHERRRLANEAAINEQRQHSRPMKRLREQIRETEAKKKPSSAAGGKRPRRS
ncbi:hypothetical protein H696_03774 [Fonticula alba]|uniref:Sas10 C-terminal domain-containing protein n=1 Tax=Fonticula alba TaxID=691883 RepID=A0A058Z737_FONAL|nr:hypothetical protein H696_03774 [Fonticula alba]KCV69342.1 hypothetical protein H696_03774 [Fonticula alba]|eukprot:XP_009495907.1 hypothetical protein H696_03774 [Fonticula alba]